MPWSTPRDSVDPLALDQLAAGDESYRLGDVAAAMSQWLAAAQAGVTDAMLNLGFAHSENGDQDQALAWWSTATGVSGEAANEAAVARTIERLGAGDLTALVQFARQLLAFGYADRGIAALTLAATGGHVHAMWLLSSALGADAGFDWFEKAALGGHPKALFILDQVRNGNDPPVM